MRIAPIEPPYEPRVSEDFAALMPPGHEPLALFRTLARNPRVLRRIRRGGLLDPGAIDLRTRELAILRTTARCGAEYEWGVHVAFFAAAAGFDDEQLRATVREGSDARCWTEAESAVVRLCDELHETSTVSDPTWDRLAAWFDDAQRVELLVLVGQYRGISGVVNAARIPLEPGAPRFP